jgi:hypothetical protein
MLLVKNFRYFEEYERSKNKVSGGKQKLLTSPECCRGFNHFALMSIHIQSHVLKVTIKILDFCLFQTGDKMFFEKAFRE